MKYEAGIEVETPPKKELDGKDHLTLLSLITIISIVILWVCAAL